MYKLSFEDKIEIFVELLSALCALVVGLGLPVAVVAGCVVLCKMAFGG